MEEKILTTGEEKKSLSFVEQFVKEDLEAGKNGGRLQTRFPPEPNGYIHIGHAKAICMDFGVAEKFGGTCNLRFDDTNPTKENTEYVDNIMSDIKWLGFHWENVYYASDYFEKLWDFAVWLITKGQAYVDEQTSEQIAEQKGTPTQPGRPSPYRDRPIEDNLRLFRHMNTAEAVEGSMVLRAKLDMANPNMHFRDPIIYRIIHIPHHRTGSKWHCYPMYDFAHGQSDYFEGVTHSICTLEFVPHRPLYDKFVDLLREYIQERKDNGEDLSDYNADITADSYDGTRQIEFNRLNLTYTVMSKRKLKALVDEKLVNGWDDPRMPTVCGMRRRGYSSQSIRAFIDSIGYTKFDALNDHALLESCVREDLNKKACRVSAVLDPVRLVITNYPEDKFEQMVRYEIEQNIPFPIDEMVCDRAILGDTAAGDKAVMIVAAKTDQMEEIARAVQSAGFTPELVDVAPLALANVLKANQAASGDDSCAVILDIGAKTTSLAIVEGEKLYNRSIPVAGNSLTREIAQLLGCTQEEAERVKCEKAYVSMGGVTEDEDETRDMIAKACRAAMTRLHAEVSRSINFYRSQQGGNAGPNQQSNGNNNDTVEDAEYEEVK